MKKLMIIGAGGHGRVIADIAQKLGYSEISFLDDGNVTTNMNLLVLGKIEEWKKYIDSYVFFVAIGNGRTRERVLQMLLDGGAKVETLIHPSAIIGYGVTLGTGCAVMAGAVINPCVKIGKGGIVNTCASVDHDCILGDYVHVAIGAHLAGDVNVGDYVWIGAGATIKESLTLCTNSIIGAGATVVKNITEEGKYIGTPARKM